MAQSPVNIADQENVTEFAQQQERAQEEEVDEADDKIQAGQTGDDSMFIEEDAEVTEGGQEQQPQTHEPMGEVEPEGEMSYHGHGTFFCTIVNNNDINIPIHPLILKN